MVALVTRLGERLGVGRWEGTAAVALFLLGAVLRLVNIGARGGWDSDQGTEMLALRAALVDRQLPVFGPQALSVGAFHHGALYYDLLLPAAWLGNGDPTFVVAEIALLGALVVPIVWWLARSIGGPAAGLIAAGLAAVSASLIGYSTFIWNPTLIEPGAALAFLGTWQAWRTAKPGWWLVAAAGLDVAAQSHLAAAVLVLPVAVVYVLALRRGPAGRRRRIVAWGLASVGLVALTCLPLIAYELSHGFAETRDVIAYIGAPTTTSTTATANPDPFTRVIFSAIRILAWPLTRWPLADLKTAVLPALLVALATGIGLFLLVYGSVRTRRNAAEHERASSPAGVRFVAGSLLLLVVALGLGLRNVSEIQALQTEQYHAAADPLVVVGTALILAALWRARPAVGRIRIGGVVAGAAIAGLVVWNVGHWPPIEAPDGGWPAAHAAVRQVEADAAGGSVAVVPLFAEKGSDAYLYPLQLDGVKLTSADHADTVVVLCDSYWLEGCGGPAEEAWRKAFSAGPLTLVERIAAAPDRTLSVYRRVWLASR